MLGMQEWLTSDTRGYRALASISAILNSKQLVKRIPTIFQASSLVMPGTLSDRSVVILTEGVSQLSVFFILKNKPKGLKVANNTEILGGQFLNLIELKI